MRKITAFAILLFSSLAFAQCSAPQPLWAATWQQTAFVALLISFFIISLLYMVGMGFNIQMFVIGAKRDLWHLFFIAMLTGMVLGMDAFMDDSVLPAFKDNGALISFMDPGQAREPVDFCNYELPSGPPFYGFNEANPSNPATWKDLQQHAVDYSVCLRRKNIGYFRGLMEINFAIGFASSTTLTIRPLGLIGFGFAPGIGLRPIMDTLGYGLYMLSVTIAQLKVQEIMLCFARNYALAMLFPLGVALSALSFTRSAGGALIALSLGLSLVFPMTYLLSEEIVQDYCVHHNNCVLSSSSVVDTLMGNAGDIAQSMFDNNGAQAVELVSLLSLDGALGPAIYIIAIASTLLPLFSIIVTLLFVKSFSSLLGSEVDFSALIKIL